MNVWFHSESEELTRIESENKFQLPPPNQQLHVERYRGEVGSHEMDKEGKKTKNALSLKTNFIKWAKTCKMKHKVNYIERKKKYLERLSKIDEESNQE
jgi:hypothetical protein